ncbi:MAG: hypothetical protein K0U98_19745 [Deltaproteobacteria bacterium]|nr:hypothetical protein [Deltaproteobacteria bacterium]
MPSLARIYFSGILCLASLSLLASEPVRLVGDFSTTQRDSDYRRSWLQEVGDRLFFSVDLENSTTPVWVSDGTAEGTARVFNIQNFPDPFDEDSPLTFNGSLLLGGGDGVTESWITDGSLTGTYPLETCLGRCGSYPSPPIEVGGKLVMASRSDGEGYELWATDGSPSGAERIATLMPGEESGLHGATAPPRLLTADQALFFGRTDPNRSFPTELWSTDGTAEGTHFLADPGEGTATFLPESSPGHLFFVFQRPEGERILWVSGGSASQTRPLVSLDSPPVAPVANTALQDDDLAFLVERFDEETDTTWDEIWKSDGTVSGTQRLLLLQIVDPGSSPPTFQRAQSLQRIGNQVFFQLRQRFGDEELWSSDGTPVGTHRVGDFDEGSFHTDRFQGPLITVANRQLLISEDNGDREFGIWALEPGSPPQLIFKTGFQEGIKHLRPFQDRGVFLNQTADEVRIWETDGTREGTRPLFSVPRPAPSSDPRLLLPRRRSVAFLAQPISHRVELWQTNGREAGSFGIDLGSIHANRDNIHQLGSAGADFLLLHSTTLLRSDGTEAGTVAISPATGSEFHRRGRQVFYVGNDEEAGREPWVANLETGQANLIADLLPGRSPTPPGPRNSDPKEFTTFGDHVYFLASAGSGANLWLTDGTAEGTRGIQNPPSPPSAFFSPSRIVSGEDQLFLFNRQNLWVIGAPPDSPRLIFDTEAQSRLNGPQTSFRGRYLFAESDLIPSPSLPNQPATQPPRLWSSDGSSEGTRLLHQGSVPGTDLGQLTRAGLTFYFTAVTAEHGKELWGTDGTTEGTRLIKDIRPGAIGSGPNNLRELRGQLLFAADDGENGKELWVSDGTPEGTRLLAEAAPGPLSSFPHEPTLLRDEVIFSAERVDVGRELFAVSTETLTRVCQPTDRRLCLQGGRIGVEVDWRNQRNGEIGVGHARPFSDDTGTFWFFDEGNVELLVKSLDGRTNNDSFWFFSGGLSDVNYWITAIDFETGRTRTYKNPAGNICGQADIRTFRDNDLLPRDISTLDLDVYPSRAPQSRVPPSSRRPENIAAPGESCPAPAGALSLQDGRFFVEVDWQTSRAGGRQGPGTAIPATDKSGYFWFFRPGNLELVVKILDGRPNNGHFWVLWGALTDVGYELRVTDTTSCQVRTYVNPEGNLCGGADNQAF